MNTVSRILSLMYRERSLAMAGIHFSILWITHMTNNIEHNSELNEGLSHDFFIKTFLKENYTAYLAQITRIASASPSDIRANIHGATTVCFQYCSVLMKGEYCEWCSTCRERVHRDDRDPLSCQLCNLMDYAKYAWLCKSRVYVFIHYVRDFSVAQSNCDES